MRTNDDAVPDVEYDPETDAYYAAFDPHQRSANEAVIESVAAVLHRDPLDIEPLYEYVNTDALDALVRSGLQKSSPYLSTSFRYAESDVTVRADGTVVVALDDDAD